MLRKSLLLMVTFLFASLFPPPVQASQQPGHIYIALMALEQAPAGVQELLRSNLDSYIAGATGPDIALAGYPLRELSGWHHPGSLPHYQKSGELIMNMLNLAETDGERAFALGWLSHYVTDTIIHPLVNRFGGYYTGDRAPAGGRKRAKQRHVDLELFEATHVFESYAKPARGLAANLENYIANPEAVPFHHIEKSFYATYVEGALSWNRFRFTMPFRLSSQLKTGATFMQRATESFVHQAKGERRRTLSPHRISDAIIRYGMGNIPAKMEYDMLKEPLQIKGVNLELRERDGVDQEVLQIKYRINDLRLFGSFAVSWDSIVDTAIREVVRNFEIWHEVPEIFYLEDMNLDTGLPEEVNQDQEEFFPGYPAVREILLNFSITDARGMKTTNIREGGDFYSFGNLKEQVWGGPAGDLLLEVPLLLSGPGPYRGEVSLDFACISTSRPYGAGDRWSGTLGGEEIRWSGEFRVETYNKMAINSIPTWQGPMGEALLLDLFPQRVAESVGVRRIVLDQNYHSLNRGSVSLLSRSEVVEWSFRITRNYLEAQERLYSVDLPPDPRDGVPEWLKKAVGDMDFPRDLALLEFTVHNRGSTIGFEYMRFVGILTEDWTGAAGTFEAGYIDYGRDIAGTWSTEPHHRSLK